MKIYLSFGKYKMILHNMHNKRIFIFKIHYWENLWPIYNRGSKK